MAIGIRVKGERRPYQPLDGERRFKGFNGSNEHPAHRRGAEGDVQGSMLHLGALTGSLLLDHQRRTWAGALTAVDTSAGKATNDGRGAPVEDAPFLSLKMAEEGKEGTQAGACVLTTLREVSARAFLAHPRAREVAVLTILAPKDEDGIYLIDPTCVHFHVGYPFVELATGLDAALSRATGRGRPRKGAVLPDTWASWVKSTCADGRSAQLCFRHPRTDDVSGWQVGTLAEVRVLALQLASRK
jgi:hypothetical protein